VVELKPVKIEMTPEEERRLKKAIKAACRIINLAEEAHVRAEKSKLIFK